MSTQWSNRTLDLELVRSLLALSESERSGQDAWKNGYHWVTLNQLADLPRAAEIIAGYGARLCTVTALRPNLSDTPLNVEYHFDVRGVIVTVTVRLDPENHSVPTITPWFRNADWNEREIAELYGIHVEGNTNPKRLFLDNDIEPGILNEMVPLTVMMNGACTTDMWERIMLINKNKGSTNASKAGEEA